MVVCGGSRAHAGVEWRDGATGLWPLWPERVSPAMGRGGLHGAAIDDLLQLLDHVIVTAEVAHEIVEDARRFRRSFQLRTKSRVLRPPHVVVLFALIDDGLQVFHELRITKGRQRECVARSKLGSLAQKMCLLSPVKLCCPIPSGGSLVGR